MSEKKKIITREQFIKGSVAGLVLVSGAGALLSGCAETTDSPNGNGNDNNNSQVATPTFPFPYKKLDPDRAAEIAWKSYWDEKKG